MIIMENGNMKIGETMIDYPDFLNLQKLDKLSPEMKLFLNETRSNLRGRSRMR